MDRVSESDFAGRNGCKGLVTVLRIGNGVDAQRVCLHSGILSGPPERSESPIGISGGYDRDLE